MSVPESRALTLATGLVTVEIQGGIGMHEQEGPALQTSYLGIMENALTQLQASRSYVELPFAMA